MFDIASVIESHKIMAVTVPGVYEVARLGITEKAIYRLKMIWQLAAPEGNITLPFNFYPPDGPTSVYWHLKLDQQITAQANMIVAGTMGDVRGQPIGGYSVRDVITDPWGAQGYNHDYLLNGPCLIRFFAEIRTVTDLAWIGGRLIAYNATTAATLERS